MIHCLITRQVKPGKEAEFQSALRGFVQRSMADDSTCGAVMIQPAEGDSAISSFGILRSFPDEEARTKFYRSDLFREWESEVEPLVIGRPVAKALHGLEAFFLDDRSSAEASSRGETPPKWKMAVLTWLGVWPSVYLWSVLLLGWIENLPLWSRSGIVTALVVPTLAWGVMPRLSRWFKPWLEQGSRQRPH